MWYVLEDKRYNAVFRKGLRILLSLYCLKTVDLDLPLL